MPRNIKVVVCETLFDLVSQHQQETTLKSSDIRLVFVGISTRGEATEEELIKALEGAEVAVLRPADFTLVSKLMPDSMKWIQSRWGGMDFLAKCDATVTSNLKKCVITRTGGLYSVQMSEYVIAAVIAMEKNFHTMFKRQTVKEWKRTSDVTQHRTLPSLTIGILGLGDIGKQVAKACNSLGMTVYGLKRTPAVCECVKKVFGMENLTEFLQASDYICNILPSTPETKGLLSGNVLQACVERKSRFINIGRGDIIDEESIITALNNGWISKAFLDVFEEEPLPESSPLWLTDNVTITPHVSGLSRDSGFVDLFYSNMMKYVKGEELKYVYCWERGY